MICESDEIPGFLGQAFLTFTPMAVIFSWTQWDCEVECVSTPLSLRINNKRVVSIVFYLFR